MREGGDYGAVGKTFSFEGNGVAETAFGRDGSVERVYVFEPGGEAITIRSGGWYGDVERRLVCERINAAVFREPEAFLQFLMFTEKSARETEAEIDEQVAKIRGISAAEPGRSRFAYSGARHTSDDTRETGGIAASRSSSRPVLRSDDLPAGSPTRRPERHADDSSDAGIDFIPDGDRPPDAHRQGTLRHAIGAAGSRLRNAGRVHSRMAKNSRRAEAAGIPLEERFQSAEQDKGELTPGRSARIPLEERFQNAEEDKEKLTPGRSTRISYEERKTGRRTQ